MEKEFKIISKGPGQTKIFIDEKPIGLIQKINFTASIQDGSSEFVQIEIVFPDLLSLPWNNGKGFYKDLQDNLDLLKDIPHVKVTLQKYSPEDS